MSAAREASTERFLLASYAFVFAMCCEDGVVVCGTVAFVVIAAGVGVIQNEWQNARRSLRLQD